MPSGRAQIYDRFLAQVVQLASTSDDVADATTLAGQRPWQTPDANGWNGSPLSLSGATGLNQAFDREEINRAYVDAALTAGQAVDNGRLGDRVACKLQIDYLAALERATRARHATSVRCAFHAAGRRKGHGLTTGPIWAGHAHVVAVLQESGQPSTPAEAGF